MIGIEVSGTSAVTETVIGMAAGTVIVTGNERSVAGIATGTAIESGLGGSGMATCQSTMTQGVPKAKAVALMVV